MVHKDLMALRRLYLGFTGARVIITANNLGIFEHLQEPSFVRETARKVKADMRAMEILLDALTGIGLLKKDRAGRYRNSLVSKRYLVKSSHLYQGEIIRHASSMWEKFSSLDEIVQTGQPAQQSRSRYDHESFIMGMHNLSLLRTEDLISAIGLKGVRRMLDLGGGPGTNAIAMAKKGVKATIFDLPETIGIARRIIRQEQVKGIRLIAGDFHHDSIGSGYDLILLSQIFHAFSSEENRGILRKCRGALNSGGRVAVQDFPITESRSFPPHSALFSVNMLVATDSGRCYTVKEMKGWLYETGFRNIIVKNLPETVLITGITDA